MSTLAANVGHQRLQLLQRNRSRVRWLRGFDDDKLEADYTLWLRLERARARMALMLVPLVAMLLAPIYGQFLLDGGTYGNEGRVLTLRAVELGCCVPACLWAIWRLKRHPELPGSTHIFLFASVMVFVGLAAIRWITAFSGGNLPAELVMLVPLAVASIGGLRNYLMLPMVWFCTVFYVFAEMAIHEGPMLARALLGISIMASISMMNAIVVDQLSRRAWLDRGIAELAAMLDGITALPNRAWFNRDAAVLMRQLNRHPVPVAVYLIDLDHFKKLNDSHGHAAGDAALAAVGELLLRQFARRPNDLVARYGGEEFVMVLYDTTAEHAAKVGQELVAAIHALRIPNQNTAQGRLTTSLGIWQGLPGKNQRIEELLALADEALYVAKGAGRNQFQLVRG